jgi:ribosomal protein S12 methylthiotransferase accessory factor
MATGALAAGGVPAALLTVWPWARWGFAPQAADEPPLHIGTVRFGPHGRRGYGYDFSSRAAALARAFGEAVERTVWCDRRPRRVVTCPERDLGADAVRMPAMLWWPPHRAPEAADWTPAPLAWTQAQGLVTGRRAWVPLQLVTAQRPDGEPRIRPVTTAGTAAHPRRDDAVLGALLELVEREALVAGWLLAHPLPRYDLDGCDDPAVREALARLRAGGLDAVAVALPTDAPLRVVAGIVIDRTGARPAGAVGLCARPAAARAVEGALREALGIWHFTRVQADAGYACPDEPAALSAATRALWWARPERWSQLAWLWAGPRVPVPADGDGAGPGATLRGLAAWLAAAGMDAWVVDLLEPPLVRRCGVHVVRVVVPDLLPFWLAEATRAFLPARLAHLARVTGCPLPGALNPLPHPFS